MAYPDKRESAEIPAVAKIHQSEQGRIFLGGGRSQNPLLDDAVDQVPDRGWLRSGHERWKLDHPKVQRCKTAVQKHQRLEKRDNLARLLDATAQASSVARYQLGMQVWLGAPKCKV